MLKQLWHSAWFHRWGIPLVIFLVAFLPRFLHPVSRTEVWADRAYHFSNAVLEQSWEHTYKRYHPGVTLMWLSGTALQIFSQRNGDLTGEQLLGIDFVRPGILSASVQAAILPLAAVISLCIALIYPLLSGLVDRKLALTAVFLLALNPFHIAYSQVIHVDGILSMFMLVSALFMINYAHSAKRSDLIWSGVFAGLSFLTKTPSLFLVPYSGLILVLTKVGFFQNQWEKQPKQLLSNFLHIIPTMLVWGGIAILIFFALWPALWVKADDILPVMYQRVVFHTSNPHRNPVFFNGVSSHEDPGIIFYLATLAWKTTLITLPAIGVGFLVSWRRFQSKEGRVLWAFILYALFFILQMGIGKFKQIAYILPAAPPLDIVAAFGLVWGMGAIGRLRRQWSWLSVSLTAVALLAQAGLVLNYYPYFGTHYNMLMGGIQTAQHMLPLQDQGEGLDMAGEYLRSLPHGQDETAILYSRSALVFQREYPGRISTEILPWARYRIYYVNQLMRELGDEAWYELWEEDQKSEPLWTFSVNGVTYVWVYGRLPEKPAANGLETATNLRLGEHIRLKRIRLDSEPVVPGDLFTAVLIWETDREIDESYTVFTHLLAADGTLIAQQDNIPLYGIRPTTTWLVGEEMEDVYGLQISEDVPPGEYRLVAGMYHSETLERLPVYDGAGNRLPDASVFLGTIQVTAHE